MIQLDPGTKPTSARPITVLGVTFRCYYTSHFGPRGTEWLTDCGRGRVKQNYRMTAYEASVDGVHIPTNFRIQQNAMRAVAKILTRTEAA